MLEILEHKLPHNVNIYLFYDEYKTIKLMHMMIWVRKFVVILIALVIITPWPVNIS